MKVHCKHILDKLVINKFISDKSSVVMHVVRATWPTQLSESSLWNAVNHVNVRLSLWQTNFSFYCKQYLSSFFCWVKLNSYVSWFQLAKLGIDIVLISRTKAKLEAVAAEIGMNSCYLTAIGYQSKSHRRNVLVPATLDACHHQTYIFYYESMSNKS